MPERFADTAWPEPKCGAWTAVFWITVGALVGFVVGLIAWAIWGTR